MKWVAVLMVAGGAFIGGVAASGESVAVIAMFTFFGAVVGAGLLAPIIVANGWWTLLSQKRMADEAATHDDSAERDVDSEFDKDLKIGVPPADRWRLGNIYEGMAVKVFSSRHSIDP